jgi:hypothetical protein
MNQTTALTHASLMLAGAFMHSDLRRIARCLYEVFIECFHASSGTIDGQGFEFTRFSVLGFNARCWRKIMSLKSNRLSVFHYLQQVSGFGESLNLRAWRQ